MLPSTPLSWQALCRLKGVPNSSQTARSNSRPRDWVQESCSNSCKTFWKTYSSREALLLWLNASHSVGPCLLRQIPSCDRLNREPECEKQRRFPSSFFSSFPLLCQILQTSTPCQ